METPAQSRPPQPARAPRRTPARRAATPRRPRRNVARPARRPKSSIDVANAIETYGGLQPQDGAPLADILARVGELEKAAQRRVLGALQKIFAE